jgi:hypothetical protein
MEDIKVKVIGMKVPTLFQEESREEIKEEIISREKNHNQRVSGNYKGKGLRETKVGENLMVIAGIVECKGTRQMNTLLRSKELMHQAKMRQRTKRTSAFYVVR